MLRVANKFFLFLSNGLLDSLALHFGGVQILFN